MTISQEEKLQILNEEPQYEFMGNEAMFEQNVVDNLDQICEAMNLAPIKQIFRQERIVVDKFHARPDIIIRHEDETRTIIEVKKVNNKIALVEFQKDRLFVPYNGWRG